MKVRLILAAIVFVFHVVACAPAVVPAGCEAQDRLPTPISADDMARLQGIANEVAQEQLNAEIVLVDADESTGTVVVGATDPTSQLCETLHARYGPLVEVIYHERGRLF